MLQEGAFPRDSTVSIEVSSTSSEWIEARTGILNRYIARDGETTCSLGAGAARLALERAERTVSDVDLIVVATSTPDQLFPSSACTIQAELSASKAFGFDLQAVCSGFVYALTVADSMVRAKQIRSALVIGSEVFSRIVDWQDRSTCVLFGDAAGAVYIEASESPGILGCQLHSDGEQGCILRAPGRIEAGQVVGDPLLRMDGQAVFKQAVSVLGNSAKATLAQAGFSSANLDLLVPHQANVRILESLRKKLKLKKDQVVSVVDRFGNTSAASVPLALEVAYTQGRLKSGSNVLLQGVGGGFTWGSVLVRM